MKVNRFIIVPEGLMANKHRKTIPYPSFLFRSVLDYVIKISRERDIIYIAPANDFGTNVYEQEVAYNYLKKNNAKGEIIYFFPKTNKYIDTRGNAIFLAAYLENDIEIKQFHLIGEKIHSYRAQYCFNKMGFSLEAIHRIKYKKTNERVAKRIWHQEYKAIHFLYEVSALIRDIVLFHFKKQQY